MLKCAKPQGSSYVSCKPVHPGAISLSWGLESRLSLLFLEGEGNLFLRGLQGDDVWSHVMGGDDWVCGGWRASVIYTQERFADLRRHVRGGAQSASMGFTPREQLCVMLGAVVLFHTSEFLLALAYHGRRRVNVASTLISGPYLIALAVSMVEHALESRFVPGLKQHGAYVSYVGLAMVVVGEVLRKLAVVTASKSFTHDIKVDKRQEHKLVTHGVYRFFRHPSYLGFFVWSIGTQVLLVNPVSAVGYTIVTWRFFDQRIPYEEYFLRRFFGQDYVDYANRVPSGMPFIK